MYNLTMYMPRTSCRMSHVKQINAQINYSHSVSSACDTVLSSTWFSFDVSKHPKVREPPRDSYNASISG